jgi:hypothetical protein
MTLDRNLQIHATAPKLSVTFHSTTKHSQLFLCLELHVYPQTHQEIRFLKLTQLAASAVSYFDSDKEQVEVTNIPDTVQTEEKVKYFFYRTKICVESF